VFFIMFPPIPLSTSLSAASSDAAGIENLSAQLGAQLLARSYFITTAESCTGGGIAQAITDITGSSQWFSHGFVSYSNRAKQQLLDVGEADIKRYGAVSPQIVEQMAMGALKAAQANVAIAVSGVAGPDGGTEEKPVGTVWIAWGVKNNPIITRCYNFSGDRKSIRNQTVNESLSAAISLLEKEDSKNTV
jgi:nicotinamide-nucleotide amidase